MTVIQNVNGMQLYLPGNSDDRKYPPPINTLPLTDSFDLYLRDHMGGWLSTPASDNELQTDPN